MLGLAPAARVWLRVAPERLYLFQPDGTALG
jgi:hypothetical protein